MLIQQLLEENIGENLCDLGLGNVFLHTTAQSQPMKEKK